MPLEKGNVFDEKTINQIKEKYQEMSCLEFVLMLQILCHSDETVNHLATVYRNESLKTQAETETFHSLIDYLGLTPYLKK